MYVIGIILIILGIISFVFSILSVVFYIILESRTALTAKTGGTKREVKYKKDVPVYSCRGRTLVFYVAMIIKHQSTGKYEYKVDGRRYSIKHTEFARKKEMPWMVAVIYIKRFPFIACTENDWGFSTNAWGFRAINLFSTALVLTVIGILFL